MCVKIVIRHHVISVVQIVNEPLNDYWAYCWLMVYCFTPLSTIVQLYHGVSWVSYQYYWSIYSVTSQSVEMLTPQPRAQRRAAITTNSLVWPDRACCWTWTSTSITDNIDQGQFMHVCSSILVYTVHQTNNLNSQFKYIERFLVRF